MYLIEPDPLTQDSAPAHLEAHAMNPMAVLRNVHAMGGAPAKILIVGCEPADFGPDDQGKPGLSAPVEAAVGNAIARSRSDDLDSLSR